MDEDSRGCPGKGALFGLLAAILIVAAAASASPADRPSGTPASSWDSFREGERRAREGHLEGALEAYVGAARSLAVALPPDRTLADAVALGLYNLAVPLTAQGRVEPALRCFEEICRLREAVGELRDAGFRSMVLAAGRKVASYAVSVGKAGASIPFYRAIREADPDDEEATLDLASAFLAAGEIDEAVRLAREVRKTNPRSAPSWDLTARASLAAADRFEARSEQGEARLRVEWAASDFEQAAKIQPESAGRQFDLGAALGRLGRLLREEGDFDGGRSRAERALAALEEAARLDPRRADVWSERGRVLRDRSRYAESAEAYARAVQIMTGAEGSAGALEEARQGRGASLFDAAADALNLGRFEEASARIEDLRRSGGVGRGDLRLLEAALEESSGRHRLIVGENERLLGESPRRGDSLLALGDLEFLYGNYEAAEGYYLRLARAKERRPPEDVIRERLLRMAPPGSGFGRAVEVDVGGARLSVVPPAGEGVGRAIEGAGIAWKRAAGLLGPMPEGPPTVRVHVGQQAFRLAAGARAGSALAVSAWADGAIHVWRDPARDGAAWASVLAPAIARWAADRLSRGRAPWWLLEGVGQLVTAAAPGEGTPRKEVSSWVPAVSLDRAWAASWNDPFRLPGIQVEAGLLVESLVSLKGRGALRAVLLALAAGGGRSIQEALESSAGVGLESLEKAARESSAAVPATPQ